MLCVWNKEWCLAQRGNLSLPGVSLAVRNGCPLASETMGFKRYWSGVFWHRYWPSFDGITFYPEVRYRGIRVYPQWWHPSSAEPLVHCWMQGIGDAVDPGRDRIEQSLDAQRRGDFALWASICEELKQKSQAMRAQLVSEGWKDKHIDGLEKYCHVDDLEKIEGPPPVGEF